MKISNFNWKKISFWLAAFWILEILSFSASVWPVIREPIAFLLVILVGILTIYKLEYGLLAVLGELFMGSMGHLFYFDLDARNLSLRVLIFAVFILIFGLKLVYQLIKDKQAAVYWQSLKEFQGLKYFVFLSIFIILALINAVLRGHNPVLIFSDFNAWLYFLLLWPLIIIYASDNRSDNNQNGQNQGSEAGAEQTDSFWQTKKFLNLQNIFLAAVLWLSFKTLFLLFIFAHQADSAASLYYWLRRTLGGEITSATSGWPRIFIQGQIYAGLAFLIIFWRQLVLVPAKNLFSRSNFPLLFLAALFLSVILVSLSRSFWVGIIFTLFACLLALGRLYSWRRAGQAVLWLGMVGILSILMIYAIILVPYKTGPGASVGTAFLDRVSGEDQPALASRWALLPVLMKEIGREPFFGQGYGATVTYFSQDPRILENNPSGEYSTYAFEWAYLDTWLKLGLVGLLTYLLLISNLLISAWRRGIRENNYLFFAIASGILFLVTTNVFTPYLNHPLGIGFLVLSACLIWPNRVS